MRRSPASSHVIGLLAAAAFTATAQAGPPEITAPRASVYDVRRAETLYKKTPGAGQDEAAMGSTAKIVTLYVALEAVKAGHVSLADLVTISEKAATQGCNCFSALEDGGKDLGPGDRMSLDDALYSVALSDGEPTVAVAEFVAKAVLQGSKVPAASWEESAALEQDFIGLMNARVDALGLQDTHFETVHGGDAAGQHTTTDDLIELWRHAAQDPKFLDYTGMREHTTKVYHTWNHPGGYQSFHFTKTFDWYHPGVDGDKGGNSTECDQCAVSQATRIGRSLVASTLQSTGVGGQNFYDAGQLLTYGFSLTFDPHYEGSSAKWGLVQDHSLAAVSANRAVSAVVTPGGALKLVTWRVDVSQGLLEEITNGPGGLVGAAAVAGGVSPAVGGVVAALIEEVKIVHLGGGHLLVATRNSLGGVELSSWGLPANGPVFFRQKAAAGQGSQVALQPFGGGNFLMARRSGAGLLVLQTWRLNLATGAITGPLDEEEGQDVSEIALAGRVLGATSGRLVAALRLADGKLRVESWGVNPATGDIAFLGADPGGAASGISVVAVSGFGARELYASALRLSNGKLKIIVYSVAPDGSISRAAERTSNDGTHALTADGRTATARFDKKGILVAVKGDPDSSVTRLTVWSIDVRDDEGIGVNFVVDHASVGKGYPALARVSDDQAEGDFLIAQKDFVDLKLRLQAYRSGPR